MSLLPAGLTLLALVCLAAATAPVARVAIPAAKSFVWLTAGAALLTLGASLHLTLVISELAERLGQPFWSLAQAYISDTRAGRLSALRLVLGLVLLGLALASLVRSIPPRIYHGTIALGGLLFAALLLAFSGHAPAADGGILTVLLQAVHLLLAALWAALILRLLLAHRRGIDLHALLEQAGNYALSWVLLLIWTGGMLAWLHGLRPHGLLHSEYGLMLSLKLALLLLALAAAAGNRFHAIRQPARLAHPRRAQHLLQIEAAAVAGTLLAAAVLARTPPVH